MAFAVPLTIGLAGLALGVVDFFNGPKKAVARPAHVTPGPPKRSRQPRDSDARPPTTRKLPRLKLRTEARAQARAGAAEALADDAR
ncbi:hypothetical protein, partial [Mycobacterium kyorinense]|uniref:hypothetical protein n=1 Tax=Mycobacterium kyorinense TaxID=487514 RepID=UPI001F17C48A